MDSKTTKFRKNSELKRQTKTLNDKELWLTIENTPEDRLDILQRMKKLKISIEKTQKASNN